MLFRSTCADIGSATRSTYTPVVGNAGKGIRVKVTAVNNAKESASAYSAITANVSNTGPANTVLPVVSGYEHVGYALSSTTGTFDAPKPTVTYQWQRCTDKADAGTCTNIASATKATYTAVTGDAGKFLRVGVCRCRPSRAVRGFQKLSSAERTGYSPRPPAARLRHALDQDD